MLFHLPKFLYFQAIITEFLKGYLRYKTITSQNVSSEAQVKNFFYFVEKLCSILKMFKVISATKLFFEIK